MFDQRIRTFTTFIARHGRRQRCSQADLTTLNEAMSNLVDSISPLVTIRGEHTHVRTFEDADIDEMQRYDKAGDFATTKKDKQTFKASAKTLLSLQRKRWKDDIKRDIGICEVQRGVLYKIADKLVWQSYSTMR